MKTTLGKATFFNSRINRVSSVHNARRSHHVMFGSNNGLMGAVTDYNTRSINNNADLQLNS